MSNTTATISATGTTLLSNDANSAQQVLLIQFHSNAFAGSITIEGQNQAGVLVTAWVPVNFVKRYLNGTAAGGGSMSGNAITDESMIEVPMSGMNLRLNCTARTSGSMDVCAIPVNGLTQ
jgi:hypothetical protein